MKDGKTAKLEKEETTTESGDTSKVTKSKKSTDKNVDTPKKDPHTKKCEEIAENCKKNHPSVEEFYVTSDYQCFLNSDKNFAVLHQSTLKEGELKTIKIK